MAQAISQNELFETLPVPVALRRMIVPAAISQIIVLIYNMADTFYIGRTNNPYMLAGASLILPVFNMLLCLSSLAGIGICQGMMPLVAYNCAAGNAPRMNRVIRLSVATGLVVAAASIILYELFTPWIVRVFISDGATVALATDFLRVRILATPLMFLSFFTVYIFQGFGNGRISLFLGVVRWAVFNIPMLYLLNTLVGMYGIVWSQIAADVLTVAVSAYVYRTRRPDFAV